MAIGPDRATVDAVALLPRFPNSTTVPDGATPAPVVHEANGLRLSIHPTGVATLTPLPGAQVHTGLIRAHLATLPSGRVQRVTTSALSPRDTAVWVAAGFRTATRLVLLRADLTRPMLPRSSTRPASAPDARLRPGRRREWPTLASVDNEAFAPQPGLGLGGLLDAVAVTPAARIRVAGVPPVGFVLAGHDVRCGYVQRLAVSPTVAGRGIGSALLADTIRWLQRRRATEVLVNTEEGNTRALALYERFGFARQPDGLVVLEWEP